MGTIYVNPNPVLFTLNQVILSSKGAEKNHTFENLVAYTLHFHPSFAFYSLHLSLCCTSNIVGSSPALAAVK